MYILWHIKFCRFSKLLTYFQFLLGDSYNVPHLFPHTFLLKHIINHIFSCVYCVWKARFKYAFVCDVLCSILPPSYMKGFLLIAEILWLCGRINFVTPQWFSRVCYRLTIAALSITRASLPAGSWERGLGAVKPSLMSKRCLLNTDSLVITGELFYPQVLGEYIYMHVNLKITFTPPNSPGFWNFSYPLWRQYKEYYRVIHFNIHWGPATGFWRGRRASCESKILDTKVHPRLSSHKWSSDSINRKFYFEKEVASIQIKSRKTKTVTGGHR